MKPQKIELHINTSFIQDELRKLKRKKDCITP